MNYFLVSHFTCMHWRDLNSDDKDYLSEIKFNLLKGLLIKKGGWCCIL